MSTEKDCEPMQTENEPTEVERLERLEQIVVDLQRQIIDVRRKSYGNVRAR